MNEQLSADNQIRFNNIFFPFIIGLGVFTYTIKKSQSVELHATYIIGLAIIFGVTFLYGVYILSTGGTDILNSLNYKLFIKKLIIKSAEISIKSAPFDSTSDKQIMNQTKARTEVNTKEKEEKAKPHLSSNIKEINLNLDKEKGIENNQLKKDKGLPKEERQFPIRNYNFKETEKKNDISSTIDKLRNEIYVNKQKSLDKKLQTITDYTILVLGGYTDEKNLTIIIENLSKYLTDYETAIYAPCQLTGITEFDAYHWGWNIYKYLNTTNRTDMANLLEKTFPKIFKKKKAIDFFRKLTNTNKNDTIHIIENGDLQYFLNTMNHQKE